MFTLNKRQLGSVDVYSLGEENGPQIEFIPAFGGVIGQIFLGKDGIPILSSFDDEKDIIDNPRYKQSLLFPFPNRLSDGSYVFDDTNYSFPINEPERNNALHGLVYNKVFEIAELDFTEESGSVELIYLYHGHEVFYPFPFTMRLRYGIKENEFSLTAGIENTGTGDLPCSFGWHPYFKTDAIAKISVKHAKIQEVDDRMLPTGSESLYDFGDGLNELHNSLDNAFRIGETESLQIGLADFSGRMINLEADSGFKFFQVYNPEKNTVAVEPVTANINALNSGDGLEVVGPGKAKNYSISISLKD